MSTHPHHLMTLPGMDPHEIAQAGMLLDRIFSTRHAADRVLDQHFREHHSGPGVRGRIGAVVYRVLRQRDVLTAQLQHHFPQMTPGPEAWAAMAVVALRREAGMGDSPWPTPLSAFQAVETPFANDQLPPWQRESLPRWLWDAWCTRLGVEETEALAQALNLPASVDVRVDMRRTTREQVRTQLAALGIEAQLTPFSPDGLRLHGRPSLSASEPYRQGLLEFQDEGSQLIGHLVAAQPGMTVVDFCAGAGGKSLHLAVLMADRGRIWAVDTDDARLHRLTPRIKRGRLKSIRTLPIRHEGDRALKKLQGSIHRVLVDAPCSATGTLRRNPEVKWRLTPEVLETFHMRQCAILQAASRLVAPRGRLIYATCSLMMRENEDVVQGFLAENRQFHPLVSMPISHLGALQGLLPPSPFFTLLPHRTRTDGFFAAILERKS
ncbi:MAG: RsmB/NOP family class I SAM-dependent RNA methyltransferase [Magnetococcales bacterium]|nr:RsmB/NOP family class I SAM-dependent RNA methyltransferase [Magnetococcales bacterium]